MDITRELTEALIQEWELNYTHPEIRGDLEKIELLIRIKESGIDLSSNAIRLFYNGVFLRDIFGEH